MLAQVKGDLWQIGELLEGFLEGFRLGEVRYGDLSLALGEEAGGPNASAKEPQAHNGDFFTGQAVGVEIKWLKDLCVHGFGWGEA